MPHTLYPSGQRHVLTDSTGATITYACDADGRLTTTGHSYDANGNETTVNGQSATYDFDTK